MRDDDDGSERGLSGWLGYELGYMDANSDQRSREAREAIWARRRGARAPYDADDVESAIATWKAAVARRDTAISQLQGQLEESHRGKLALRQQVAAAGQENQALREQVAKLEHDIELMQNSIQKMLDLHDAEIARLKRRG